LSWWIAPYPNDTSGTDKVTVFVCGHDDLVANLAPLPQASMTLYFGDEIFLESVGADENEGEGERNRTAAPAPT